MKTIFIKKSGGVTLIEMVVYIALLLVMIIALTYSIRSLLVSYNDLKLERKVEQSALAAMDRITRDIRNATSINAGQSSFGNSNGSLSLNVATSGGGTQATRFYLSGGRVYVDEDGVQVGPLTSSAVTASSLLFRSIATTTSAAVKVELTLSATTTSNQEKFYDTVILRGSY